MYLCVCMSALCRSSSKSSASQLSLGQHMTPVSDNDRILSLQLALKCADLGHLSAPLNVHLQWVQDLEEE